MKTNPLLPEITISSVDLHRIDVLLETLPPSQGWVHDALVNELARAAIVDPVEMPPRTVTMNSRVRFRLEDGTALCRTLVYPKDVRPDGDTLSVLTPVGSALLGLSEGDRIGWTHADGRPLWVEVLEIVYQPERAGDYHL